MSSDPGFPMSDGPSRTPRQRRSDLPSSSLAGRPRGPLSESLGARSDDDAAEGFEDDAIPGRRPTDAQNIPKVEDRLATLIAKHFEDFIEGYAQAVLVGAHDCDSRLLLTSSQSTDIQRIRPLQTCQPQAP